MFSVQLGLFFFFFSSGSWMDVVEKAKIPNHRPLHSSLVVPQFVLWFFLKNWFYFSVWARGLCELLGWRNEEFLKLYSLVGTHLCFCCSRVFGTWGFFYDQMAKMFWLFLGLTAWYYYYYISNKLSFCYTCKDHFCLYVLILNKFMFFSFFMFSLF